MLNGVRRGLSLTLLLALLLPPQAGAAENAGNAFAEALENISVIHRPGQVGYATIWDGNKYVQCYGIGAEGTRCEAAGVLMQPSLERVMRPDALEEQGWAVDASFGNYVRTFPGDTAPADIADAALAILTAVYEPTRHGSKSERNGCRRANARRAMARRKIWPA